MKWSPSGAIVVDITPSQVTFSDMDGVPVSLAPFVYVAADHRRKRILGVGVTPPNPTRRRCARRVRWPDDLVAD